MNAPDNHRHDSRNGQRRPEDIQADIERTRSDLNETLSAIERRLSPGELIDQGLDYLRHSGAREYASNLGHVAKQDPVPLALAGIGLAWLMMSSGRQRNAAPAGADQTSRTSEGAPGTASQMAGGMREAAHKVSDQVSDKMSNARQRLSQTAQSARERAGQVGDTARRQADRMREGMQHVVQEQPLALGAIGLALGAVLGAVASRTRTEDEWMGEASDRMREGAKDTLHELSDSNTQPQRPRPDGSEPPRAAWVDPAQPSPL